MFGRTQKKKQEREKAPLLYDLLMAQIEPELTSAMLPKLAEMYAEETPEEAVWRAKHYERAFLIFAEMWDDFVAACEKSLQHYKDTAFSVMRKKAGSEDAQELSAIEREINES
jgi:hypothetical protein